MRALTGIVAKSLIAAGYAGVSIVVTALLLGQSRIADDMHEALLFWMHIGVAVVVFLGVLWWLRGDPMKDELPND